MTERERWGPTKNVNLDEEDEFDTMMLEKQGDKKSLGKEIGVRHVEEEEEVEEETEQLPGGKTMDEMSEEVP